MESDSGRRHTAEMRPAHVAGNLRRNGRQGAESLVRWGGRIIPALALLMFVGVGTLRILEAPAPYTSEQKGTTAAVSLAALWCVCMAGRTRPAVSKGRMKLAPVIQMAVRPEAHDGTLLAYLERFGTRRNPKLAEVISIEIGRRKNTGEWLREDTRDERQAA